uniref:RxLR effector candidate protein n=1 Tax=Hyaloperonospora arabidopsidis (strain Emoy2) TaxID=559515 RepID=M4BNL9_HYAAE
MDAAALFLLLLSAWGLHLAAPVVARDVIDSVPPIAAVEKQDKKAQYLHSTGVDKKGFARDGDKGFIRYKGILGRETSPEFIRSADDVEKEESLQAKDGGQGADSRLVENTNEKFESESQTAGLKMTSASIGVVVGAGGIDGIAGSAGILARSKDTIVSTGLGLTELSTPVDYEDVGATVERKGADTHARSHGLKISVGSIDLNVAASFEDIRTTPSISGSDVTVDSHKRRHDTGDKDLDACAGFDSTYVESGSPDVEISAASPDSRIAASSLDVDTPMGSLAAHPDSSSLDPTGSPGIDQVAQVTASPLNLEEFEKSSSIRVVVGFIEDNASTVNNESSGCIEEPSLTDDMKTAPCASKLVLARPKILARTTDDKLTVFNENLAVSKEASSMVNVTKSGSYGGRNEVVKVLSLAEQSISLSESKIGSERWNMYPGDSSRPTCEHRLFGSSCPSGYKTCVSTDSYKVSTSSATPYSVAEATFTLLAADIVGAFFNLGKEDPMTRKSNWWITISLPGGWRFVAWERTAVKVTLRNGNNDIVSAVRVYSCFDVTNDKNCDADTHRPNGFDEIKLRRPDVIRTFGKYYHGCVYQRTR